MQQQLGRANERIGVEAALPEPIAQRVGTTPAWVFHGEDDRVVPVSESRQMVEAIKAIKGSVRYSEYEGVGHNVWLNALGERELLPWLLMQRLHGAS